jgi:hypothetical protein
MILFRSDPECHIPIIWRDKETLRVSSNACHKQQIIIKLKCVFFMKFYFIISNYINFSFSSTSYYFVIFKPRMISEKVILRDFKWRHGFECVFLDSPKFPMTVTTCTYLMIVFRVKWNSSQLGFKEIVLPKYSVFMEPIICNNFTVISIGDNQSYIFRIIREWYWHYWFL